MGGFSVGAFVFPPLARYICDMAGWRYLATIMSACMLQSAWLVMFLRPKTDVGSATKAEDPEGAADPRTSKLACCSTCLASLGCHLLHIKRFAMFCFATIFFNIAFSSFNMHIVNKAIFIGTDKQKAALVPSIVGLCGMTGRFVWGFFTTKFQINKLYWYGCGIFLFGVNILILNSFSEFIWLATFSGATMFFGGETEIYIKNIYYNNI